MSLPELRGKPYRNLVLRVRHVLLQHAAFPELNLEKVLLLEALMEVAEEAFLIGVLQERQRNNEILSQNT